MDLSNLIKLAQSAATIASYAKAIPIVGPEIAPVVDAVTNIADVVEQTVTETSDALSTDDLGKLNAILEPLHADVLAISAQIDQAASQAAAQTGAG